MAATILLVDADSSNRADWEALLRNQGYKVFSAENGKTALEECPRLQPDLVLLQVSLPDMSGIEVCRRLRANPLNRLTPIVLIAPLSSASDSWQGREAGADDFWGRPPSRWEALTRVQSTLQLKFYIDDQAESVVASLARSIEARDPMTDGHSERLVQYAISLAGSLAPSQGGLEALAGGRLVHDTRKVSGPEALSFQPAPLSSARPGMTALHPSP